MSRGGGWTAAGSSVPVVVAVLIALLVGYPLLRLRGGLVAEGGALAGGGGSPRLRLGEVLWTEGGAFAGVVGSPGFGDAVRNTVVLALAVTGAAVPIGVAMALVLRRPDLPGRSFWQA